MSHLQADDQMDLASPSAMLTDDIDFVLDDIPQVSTEPNQDLLLQDEPEEPTAGSDSMRSAVSHTVDDDLMLDEGILIQETTQTEIIELSMDNHQDAQLSIDEDDDILYEDEEDLQQEEGLHEELIEEQPLEDGNIATDRQSLPEINISDYFDDDLQAEADMEIQANRDTQGDEDSNKITVSQSFSAPTAVGENEESGATTPTGNNTLPEQEHVSKTLEAAPDNGFPPQEANEGHYPANADVKQGDTTELEESVTHVHEQGENGSRVVDNPSPPQGPGSSPHIHVQATRNLAHGENDDKPLTHTQLPYTVKVNYLDTEMCLFPPIEDDGSEMFFLEDVSLAYSSVDKMLAACRDVLANTIGEDDELVLDVASLGLHIAEGSRYATQITLSQVVDVYVALAHNDNVAEIEPLCCSLSSRVCLASQYAYLQSAASEGKTLTQIAEEYAHLAGEDEQNAADYEQAQSPDQKVWAESEKPEDAAGEEQSISTHSRREQTSSSVEIANGGNHQSLEDSDDINKEEVAQSDGIYPETAESNDREKSQMRTVDEHPDGIGGDYDLFFNLCFKPGICSCSSCANITAGTAVAAPLVPENEEPIEDMFGLASANPDSTAAPDSDAALTPDEIDQAEPDTESSKQESVSSRTLEAENNQFEEDLFSQDDDHPPHGGSDQHSGTQHYADEFGLDEQSYSGVGFESGIGPYEEPRNEVDLSNVEQRPELNSNFPSSIGVGAHHESDERNEGDILAIADDEFLNFEDTEGDKDQTLAPFTFTHLAEVEGNETAKTDPALKLSKAAHRATSTIQNEVGSSGTDSKSTLLGPQRLQSPLGRSTDGNLTEPAENAPTTPSGGRNGSKRKAVEDEDDFDLFDTSTPDKKRHRPSL